MGTLRHLTTDAVRAIHRAVLNAHGGSPGLRDAGLLESAVSAPQASYDGKPLFSDPIEAGAAYLHYLCQNHPFIDGNKRTALAACLVFLDANQALPDPDQPSRDIVAWERLMLDVAASRLDRSATAGRLRELLERSP
jgi:death-on-curing protein